MLSKAHNWLASEGPQRRGAARATVLVAWAVLAVALLHPPHGLDWTLCFSRAMTGMPCPGCGLMRSVSCTASGRMAEAWHYHAFGPLLLLGALTVVIMSLLPRSAATPIRDWLERHARGARLTYVCGVGAFLTFGAVRGVAWIVGR